MASNFAEAMQNGYAFGMQQRQDRENRERQSALSQLAAQSYHTPRSGQRSLLSEMALKSPEFAAQQEQQFNQQNDVRGKHLRSMAMAYQGLEPTQRAQFYETRIRPEITWMYGDPGEFNEQAVAGVVKQVLASGGDTGQAAVHSSFRGGNGNMWTLGRDGNPRDTGVPYARDAQLYTDGEGGVHWLRPPTESGGAGPGIPGAPPASNQGPAGTTRFNGPDGMPIDIGGDIDAETRASILQNPKGWSATPDGGSVEMPEVDRTPAQFYSGSGGGAGGGAPSAGGGGIGTLIPGIRGPRKQDASPRFIQLTPDEVKRAGLPAGTVAQRNETTGAIDVVSKPDSRTGSGGVIPLSAGEAAGVRKQLKETKDAFNMFKAFDEALAEIPNNPSLLMDGAARGRLGTAYNNARASLRILYNTGVLQPGELPMLEHALRDPNSFTAIMDPRTRPQIDAQLDELYRVIERNIDTQVESYPQLFNVDVYRQKKAAAQQSPARYKVGQVITEGGKRYRVTGGDLNGNPEVEEVR